MKDKIIILTCALSFVVAISQLSAEESRDAKLKAKLPENVGRVAYGGDGTQTYFVTNPSNPPKAIFSPHAGKCRLFV